MEVFAESDSRTFISFHSDSGTNGQSDREYEEAMDTNPVNLDVPDHLSITSIGVIAVYEIAFPCSEPTEHITWQTDRKPIKRNQKSQRPRYTQRFVEQADFLSEVAGLMKASGLILPEN